MKTIVLPTRRAYDPRLFWALLGLNAPAAFLVIPFAMHLQRVYAEAGAEAPPGWGAVVIDKVATVVALAVLIRIGLALANRIGLGAPLLESLAKREPPPRRFRGILAVGVLVGFAGVLILIGLDAAVFRAPMLSQFQELGIKTPQQAITPPLYGLMAAISAGVTEETMFRLFGLTLIAWLGGLLVKRADGRPGLAVLWTANLLFAVLFAAAHLFSASAVGWPMSPLVITRTLVLNGLGGMAFGWLFWTYGLESAMLAHFFTDVGLYVLLPLILLREDPDAKALTALAVVLGVVLVVIWAARTIADETEREEVIWPMGLD